MYDKIKNEITLIEVEITSQDRLKQAEVEKCHKYDLLGRELSSFYDAQVKIIPLVMTWDGVVSKFFKNYIEKLAIEDWTRTYIQSVVLKKTLESMMVEHRHGIKITNEEINSASSLIIEASRSYEDNIESGEKEAVTDLVTEDKGVVLVTSSSKRRRLIPSG